MKKEQQRLYTNNEDRNNMVRNKECNSEGSKKKKIVGKQRRIKFWFNQFCEDAL